MWELDIVLISAGGSHFSICGVVVDCEQLAVASLRQRAKVCEVAITSALHCLRTQSTVRRRCSRRDVTCLGSTKVGLQTAS